MVYESWLPGTYGQLQVLILEEAYVAYESYLYVHEAS